MRFLKAAIKIRPPDSSHISKMGFTISTEGIVEITTFPRFDQFNIFSYFEGYIPDSCGLGLVNFQILPHFPARSHTTHIFQCYVLLQFSCPKSLKNSTLLGSQYFQLFHLYLWTRKGSELHRLDLKTILQTYLESSLYISESSQDGHASFPKGHFVICGESN